MSRQKPGRNDPCPCGSGKKYKACHAAEDRAREAAAPPAAGVPPLAGELQAAMELLRGDDLSRISQALERLGALLAGWGPAPGLRFEAQAFDQHVSRELERMKEAAERDPDQARDALQAGTVSALGTRSFLERLRATLLARATTAGLSSEDRQALCLGALLASLPRGGRFQPEGHPLMDVVFDVQFQEWAARQGEGASREKDEVREQSARVEAAMRQRSTPSVFSPEEQVWLTSVLWQPLSALKAPDLDAKARRAAVSAFLGSVRAALDADAEFLAGMLERLRAQARDPALDEATRSFFADAAAAFEAEPVRLVLAAVLTSRNEPQARSAEEQVVLADLEAKTRWTAEDFEPYRQWLEAMRLPAAAERIRRAQEWLRSHPLAL